MANVDTHREDALPACYGIGPNNGVDGPEFVANILWCTARLVVVQFEAVPVCCRLETRLIKCDAEGFEELLVRGADSVVQFVPRGPKRV